MKNTLQVVAILTVVAVAIFLMGAPTAEACHGFGYGYGYSSYCAPVYNHYCAPVYPIQTCIPSCYTPYFNPCYRGW